MQNSKTKFVCVKFYSYDSKVCPQAMPTNHLQITNIIHKSKLIGNVKLNHYGSFPWQQNKDMQNSTYFLFWHKTIYCYDAFKRLVVAWKSLLRIENGHSACKVELNTEGNFCKLQPFACWTYIVQYNYIYCLHCKVNYLLINQLK